MMIHILITDAAHRALISVAEREFVATGVWNPQKEQWSIPIHKETFDVLFDKQLDGETISDCIIRLVATRKGYS